MVDMEDPLASLPAEDAKYQDGVGVGSMPLGNHASLTLTDAGLRVLLSRKKIRTKPFLELKCIGCACTTWSRDRWCKNDYQEQFVLNIVE